MKAAVIRQFGDPDVLRHEDVATPAVRPGQVLVKVLAAGVNRLDHYLREGSVVPELPFPHVFGSDVAGEVAEVGANVTGFAAGERVIVVPGFALDEADADVYPAIMAPSFALPGLGIWGGYAQYIEVPARGLIKDDTGLAPEQVATLPVVLATAARAVKVVGGVKAGDRVLVQAGASGSGSMQIQVAQALGAEVATTVRGTAKAAFARTIGADLVIDARRGDVAQAVKDWTGGQGADVVIDNLGGDVLAASLDALKAMGTVVALGFTAGTQVNFDIRAFFFAQKQLKGSMASDASDLEWGLDQVRAGRIEPLLDHALPLREAAEAHRLIAAGAVTGNLVLLPWAA